MNEEAVIWHLGFMSFHARTLINTWLVMASVYIFCRLGVRHLTSGKPGKMQNVLEWLVDFVKKIVSDNMNYEQGRPILSYLLTLIMFVFFSNMVSVIPNLTFGLFEYFHIDFAQLNKIFEAKEYFSAAPTSDINVTAALALLTITLVLVLGVKTKGMHYFHHFFEPYKPFFIIHLIDMLAKPLTLAFRLFGNIFAGEILVKVIWMLPGISVLPGILPQVIWLAFSIFIGAIQAYVFTVLTTAYVAQAVTPSEH
ncbi:F0F1-type ATP synthase, alpha subunit [Desulfosporosinus youngiae DSM 17734]|uniref:ATP synthase subunit a n=1 Tax=Desulfosporosinus youngiae DSM 17734 TaxID=768710 RepID=H5Y2E4_9FIRM|nr:F0F1-type ATP synthase, alpha subunit [Desulfosporosinus youngiae DSM 17734]